MVGDPHQRSDRTTPHVWSRAHVKANEDYGWPRWTGPSRLDTRARLNALLDAHEVDRLIEDYATAPWPVDQREDQEDL